MPDFVLKAGDTSPALEAELTDDTGAPIDLTDATVHFHMRARSTDALIDQSASIQDAENGVVVYDWGETDTAVAGDYDAEFSVEFSNGDSESYPNDRNLHIVINDGVA